MMPSMPRFSTPARSHSSTPSVPKISGVAMRSTADQKSALAKSSRTSTPVTAQAQIASGGPATLMPGAHGSVRTTSATSMDTSDTATMTSAM